ncbi:MAG: 4-(cytidine 5'-diphospho)-2-C-methyl-D-erythritol kinase [Gammaproteobacteria bacterium]|nr:4-(cytidine 5'-diphospho)-2-C-methyl-D-erythritol kinase [Gammaproteobacteria bacterium]MCF6362324.1 4-(cytidine 5'-diphospho)-2-C-methyl-D-erythritol kinase [Gammaproteobacteria bacterium]
MSWPAPAKLNLFLHITGRRMDGYHELQTLFQFIDFGDELRFRVDSSGVVRRREALAGVAEEADLTVRAARLLQAETGCAQGVEIHIDKRLPMGGGLGGGSSDAATTLVVLNRLWGLGLSEDRLAALGLQLGADVPVFVHGRAAWAEGVGERLQFVDLPEPWFVILQPDAHVATAELFVNPQLTRDLQPIKMRDYLAGGGRNVFEPLVRAAYPDVDAALVWLNARAAGRMTGTGACVFATFEREAQARDVAEQAEGRWRAIVARGCNRSPLLTACRG